MSSDSDAVDQLGYVQYFQFWTDEELRWIDLDTQGDKALESFLLRWSQKKPGLFRTIWRFQPKPPKSFTEQVMTEVYLRPPPESPEKR